MVPNEPDPIEQSWEVESEDAFLERVEQLVTSQSDTLKRMRHLRELAILYEGRAQFLVELKERCEQALVADSGVVVPDHDELLDAHEEEVRAEWDATEPVPDITILEDLWPGGDR
jgi:hypothetical protein